MYNLKKFNIRKKNLIILLRSRKKNKLPNKLSQITMTDLKCTNINMFSGDILGMMWLVTIKRYPKLAIIDNNNYIHEILACSTEEAQDRILDRFLKEKDDSKIDLEKKN